MARTVKKLPKKQFEKFIHSRDLEDLEAIYAIEKLLKEKRGYVYKLPPKGSPVVLLVSGGIDSTVAWFYLMKEYQYDVYPLFLHRGTKSRVAREAKSVAFFTDYYKQVFGEERVRTPKRYSTALPPKEIFESLKKPKKFFHPRYIAENLVSGQGISNINIFGTVPYMFPLYGVNYAKELQFSKNITVRHIFNTVAVGDGTIVPSQTYTALRSTMLSMCLATADWSWNFASLAMEREINHFFTKADLITYGHKHGLPLEKTWSCYGSAPFQCGDNCLTCFSRRREFKTAGVIDKTVYLSDLPLYQRYRSFQWFFSQLRGQLFGE